MPNATLIKNTLQKRKVKSNIDGYRNINICNSCTYLCTDQGNRFYLHK